MSWRDSRPVVKMSSILMIDAGTPGAGEANLYFLMTNVWVCPLTELDSTVTSLPLCIDS